MNRPSCPPGRRRASMALALLAGLLAGCATTPPHGSTAGDPAVINVVAAENFWGSLAAQLGGAHAHVTSIINSPDADPHDYEATAADGRQIASAQMAIINGVGYDPWAAKLVQANPSPRRTVLTVGELVGVPGNGNPHRWYNPDNVRAVIDQITRDYQAIDRADAAFFEQQHSAVVGTALKPYFDLIAQIKATYGGTPIGASESIFAMLAPALGLNLITPPGFLTAITEGTDPSASDKATIDAQIAQREIKVYIYNSQNATPDVQAQVRAAKARGIPVTTITETLTPAGASFQEWQVAQFTALRKALAEATGKADR